MRLRAHVSESGLGVVLVAPIDLIIQRSPLRIRQPDILYLSAERTGVKGRAELKGLPALEMSPDLVVEILPPATPAATSRISSTTTEASGFWKLGW